MMVNDNFQNIDADYSGTTRMGYCVDDKTDNNNPYMFKSTAI